MEDKQNVTLANKFIPIYFLTMPDLNRIKMQ